MIKKEKIYVAAKKKYFYKHYKPKKFFYTYSVFVSVSVEIIAFENAHFYFFSFLRSFFNLLFKQCTENLSRFNFLDQGIFSKDAVFYPAELFLG